MGGIASGQKTEHHSWRQGAAGAAIGHTHGGSHDVARCVEPGHDVTIQIQHSTRCVGSRPAFGAQRAAFYFNRVIGWRIQPTKRCRRLAFHSRITPPVVMGAVTAMEVGVVSRIHVLIPAMHGSHQPGWIDSELLSQIG